MKIQFAIVAIFSLNVYAAGPVTMPEAGEPLWLQKKTRLHDFQSQSKLPRSVDVLIVGAGLTGASAAYHLVGRGLKVAVVDARGVGEGATGRNGGNFELMPESFLNAYEGLVNERRKFLKLAFPDLDFMSVERLALAQAKVLIRFGQENARIFRALMANEKIDADFSDSGWLRIANSQADEKALVHDLEMAGELGSKMEMWSPAKILEEVGIVSEFGGRMAPGFGNYHPYKFVNEVFERVLSRGVELYTQTRVTKIDWSTPKGEPIRVETTRGTVLARKVILATDAYSSKLAPELSAVEPYQSQVLNFDDVPNRLGGRTITEENGDLYYNGPLSTHYTDAMGVRRMILVIGGGPDQPVPDADFPALSREAFDIVVSQAGRRFPEIINQPVARTWTGVFGFTADRLPILDYVYPGIGKGVDVDDRVVAFVGSQGYGGCMSMLGGYLASEMVTKSKDRIEALLKKYSPNNDFSLKRFFRGSSILTCQGSLHAKH